MNDDLGKNVLACIERLEVATGDLKAAFAAYLEAGPSRSEDAESDSRETVVDAVAAVTTETAKVMREEIERVYSKIQAHSDETADLK